MASDEGWGPLKVVFCGLWDRLRPQKASCDGEGSGPPACFGGYWGCDCCRERLRTTRDVVVAIGLAEHHKCGFLWKLV